MTARPETARSSDEIRADIERTRERLGDTVEALGAQLNPSHLKQRVKDSVREATIGRVQHMASNTSERLSATGRDLARTIRENPLPAAMVAAGLGWLLISSNRGRERDRDRESLTWDSDESRFNEGTATAEREGRGLVGTARQATDRVVSGTQHVAQEIVGRAQDLAESAQIATQRVAERARDTTQRVAERARNTTERVTDRARSAAHRVEDRYDQSPIAVGALAVAMGVAVGMAFRGTAKEARLMGAKRDELFDKAKEQISETKEKVENVVERAVPEVQAVIRDAAREEGLTR